ncbi:MAG: M28 family peptidase [Cyclobacteriaceae bacterium]|nr:M28 family peptidase [Cytophagales bacterium]MBX2901126.1 M28 family peptidase [Cyclobacteriaceae bacterium]
MKKILLLGLWATSIVAFAQQNPAAVKYAATITEKNLKDDLSILASDALEGRETGKRGQKMAAAFIAAHFQDLGLKAPVNGSYYQPVPLYGSAAPTVTIKTGTTELRADEYVSFGGSDTGGPVTLPLVYLGAGTAEELAKVDVKDKAVLVALDPTASMMRNPTLTAVREKGAKVIFAIVEKAEDFQRFSGMARNFRGGGVSLRKPAGGAPNAFFVSTETAGKLFNTTYDKLKKSAGAKVAKVKPAQVSYSVAVSAYEVKSENVLGFLEGTDKKDEVLVITAHYDHIGISPNAQGDKINNGADDDGSGTVGVLALAKAFAQAKQEGHTPRRSILFMTVTGEEKGLLGSEYYSENPVYPLDKTVVNLNIDMIGRRDPQHKDSAPYVYVIGSDRLSSELHTLSETTNKTYTNLLFDYTYNAEDHPDRIYYRSDHWNFAKKNIPIIFYFDGIHEDYHKPSDEVDKIEFDLLAKRTQTVFYAAWEIANRDGRLVVDKAGK